MRHFVIFGLLALTMAACATTKKPKKNILLESQKESVQTAIENETALLLETARSQYLRGDYVKATTSLESAKLLLGSTTPQAVLTLLNHCYLATGRYLVASKMASELSSSGENTSAQLLLLGMSELLAGHLKSAKSHLESALDLEEDNPQILFYLGILSKLEGQIETSETYFKKAEREYRQIIRKNPDDLQSLAGLIYLYGYLNNNLDHALTLTDDLEKKAQEGNFDRHELFATFYVPYLRGIILIQSNEVKGAIVQFTRALRAIPTGSRADLAEIYFYLGKSYFALEKHHKALSFFQKARQTDNMILYGNDLTLLISKADKYASKK